MVTSKWAFIILFRRSRSDEDLVERVLSFWEPDDMIYKDYLDNVRLLWACQRLLDPPRMPNL